MKEQRGTGVSATATVWRLVHAKPRQEGVAKTHLERQGFETYLPLAPAAQRSRRRGAQPLFPRYLFLATKPEDNLAPVRSTVGVASLVRFGGEPAVVPATLVAALRARESAGGLHEWALRRPRGGERVVITDGAFTGYEGIFLAPTRRDRVLVLLKILGRPTRLAVPAAAIEAHT